MRFFIVLVLIVAGLLGLGLYRGWFHVSADGSADKSSVTVTVDKEKIEQDKNNAQKKAQDLKQK